MFMKDKSKILSHIRIGIEPDPVIFFPLDLTAFIMWWQGENHDSVNPWTLHCMQARFPDSSIYPSEISIHNRWRKFKHVLLFSRWLQEANKYCRILTLCIHFLIHIYSAVDNDLGNRFLDDRNLLLIHSYN